MHMLVWIYHGPEAMFGKSIKTEYLLLYAYLCYKAPGLPYYKSITAATDA